jgi:hypothetical protein
MMEMGCGWVANVTLIDVQDGWVEETLWIWRRRKVWAADPGRSKDGT